MSPQQTVIRVTIRPIDIEVTNTNRVPQLVPLAQQFGREDAELQFRIVGGDLDGGALTLTASGVPAEAVFDDQHGRRDLDTTCFDQAGDYTLTFQLTDDEGLFDTTQVDIHIDNVNRPAVLTTSQHQAVLGQSAGLPRNRLPIRMPKTR